MILFPMRCLVTRGDPSFRIEHCYQAVTRMRESALYQPHNTMLIHTSRFKRWQNKTKELVSEYFEETRDRIINECLWVRYNLCRVETCLAEASRQAGEVESYLTDKYVDAYLTNIVFDSVIKYVPEIIGTSV